MIELLERWIAPLKRRVLLMIGKALINTINDSGGIQIVQINLGNDELIDGVERVQNYGFTSHPEAGAEAIVAMIGGNRDHPVVIAADDSRYRPELAEGETAVYNKHGRIVKLEQDFVLIGSSGLKKLVNETFQSLFNNHVHNIALPGPLTGTTSSPATATPGTPVAVAPGAPAVLPFGAAIGANELTSKTKAE